MTQTGTLKALGSRSIIGAFNKRLEEVSMASWIQSIALMITTDVETETVSFLSDAPAMRERITDNLTEKDLRPYSFTITNKDWSAALPVRSGDWRRAKTDHIMIRARELGARAAQLPQSVLSKLLNDNGNAYDGVAFYHASGHVNLNGDQIVNIKTITGGVAPSNAAMETGILTGIETILGFKDDEGEPRNEFAQSFVVMVPVALWKQASAALRNDFIAAGTSNSIKASQFNIRLVMNPRLTHASRIYIFREDSDVRSLVWQDEVLPVMQSLTQGSEFEIINDRMLFIAKRVGNGGYGRFDMTCRVEFTA